MFKLKAYFETELKEIRVNTIKAENKGDYIQVWINSGAIGWATIRLDKNALGQLKDWINKQEVK